MDRPRKLLTVLGLSIGIAAAVIVALFLLEWGRGDAPESSERAAAPATGAPIDATPLERPLTADAPDASEAGTPEEVTAEAVAVEPDEPPMLTGIVSGEGSPIASARVLVFAARRIEAAIRRLERFDPGSGMPDIPAVIADVKEEIERFRDSAVEARTDAEGRYAFRRLEPGGYFALTLAEGWVFRYGDVAAVEAGVTRELDLELDRGAAIAGRVVDGAGAGVAGVTVVAEFRPPGMQGVGRIVRKLLGYVNGEFLRGPFETTSGADGAFEIASLPPGVYDLAAEKPGFPEARLESVATGTREAVVLFPPGSRVEGLLVDVHGLPVPDIDVRLIPERQAVVLPFPGAADIADTVGRLVGEPERRALSDGDGAFRFETVGAGRYTIEVEAPGWLPVERQLEVLGGEGVVAAGAISLDAGGVISGWVRAPGGAPIAGARVSVFPEGMTMFTMGGVMSDAVSGRTTASAGENGAFRIAGLAEGRYSVLAQARGFGSTSRSGVAAGVAPGGAGAAAGEHLDLVLEPGITVTGLVIDAASEERIAGATVSASGASTMTDADGRFLIEGVAPRLRDFNPFRQAGPGGGGGRGASRRRGGGGEPRSEGAPGGEEAEREPRVDIRARAKGYQEKTRVLTLAEAAAGEVIFALEIEPRIRGIALDPDGEPLPGVLARLAPGIVDVPFPGVELIFFDIGVSNLDGEFVLDAPREQERFSILASHPLYATTRSDPFVAAEVGPDDLVEVRLARGGAVRGTVTDGVQPVAGALVRLARSREVDPGQRFMMNLLGLPKEGHVTYSSTAGEFSYERVLPGDYVLTAERAGFTDARSETLSLAEGETREVPIVMDPGGEIAGRAVDGDGFPVAGARIRLLREGGIDRRMEQAQRFLGGAFKTALAGDEGEFAITGLPAGSYTVLAEKKGFTAAEAAGVSPGDDPIELVLVAAASIEGRVVDSLSGAAIPDFEFRVAPVDSITAEEDELAAFRARAWRQRRDSDGRFFERGLAAGRYRVEARSARYALASRELFLAAGDVEELVLALDRAGVLAGKVVDAETGLPVEGVRIGLARTSGDADGDGGGPSRAVQSYFEEAAFGRAVQSGEDGAFTLDTFPPGPQTVVLSHDDYIQEFRDGVEVTLGEELDFTVRLRSGLSVSGTVVADPGDDGVGGFLLLRGVSEAVRRVHKGTGVGPGGSFRIAGLEPGTYDLILTRRGPGAAPSTHRIELAEADIDDLVLGP